MLKLLKFWQLGKRLAELSALILSALDERVEPKARLITVLVIAYALLPVDIVPEFIPFAGIIDDLLLAWFGLSKAAALIPDDIMQEHKQTAQRAGRKAKRVLLLIGFLVALWLAATAAGIVFIVRWIG